MCATSAFLKQEQTRFAVPMLSTRSVGCKLNIHFSPGVSKQGSCPRYVSWVSLSAYGVLSRGLLGGTWSRERTVEEHDFRKHAPRFQGDNLERNLALVEALRTVAETRKVTVAQLAIAWALSRGDDVIPLIGARSRIQLQDGLGAMEIDLTQDDLNYIEAAVPDGAVAGDRYPQMDLLDSER